MKTRAEQYLREILENYSQILEIQKEINRLADEAQIFPDYEDYKESIESYKTN